MDASPPPQRRSPASISQFLSGTVELSDDRLDRLLSCMGYRLEVTRQARRP
jgi:hypothetical protein